MRHLLDTNVVSELRKKADRRAPEFNRWAAALKPVDTYLSVITVMELRVGIERRRRKDRVQAELLDGWLNDTVLSDYERRILGVDQAVAEAAVPMHVPATGAARDVLIAATAKVHDLMVATRNVKDFSNLGVAVENPWSE